MNQMTIDLRPQKFSELYGAEKVKSYFNKRDPNAYPKVTWLIGQSGTGKTTTSKILVKSLQCKNLDENNEPCCQCDICKGIEDETYNRDTLVIVGSDASKATLGEEIREFLLYPPTVARNKVVMLEEVGLMTAATEKALLPILENANSPAYFIGTSMTPLKDISTDGRGIAFTFKEPQIVDIAKYLNSIMIKMGWDKDPTIPDEFKGLGLFTIAQSSFGSFRKALGTLQLCIETRTFDPAQMKQDFNLVDYTDFLNLAINICNCKLTKADYNAIFEPVDYQQTVNFLAKVLGDAESLRLFNRVPGNDNKFFKDQAQRLISLRNYDLLKAKIIELTKKDFIKKTTYVLEMCDLVNQCYSRNNQLNEAK